MLWIILALPILAQGLCECGRFPLFVTRCKFAFSDFDRCQDDKTITIRSIDFTPSFCQSTNWKALSGSPLDPLNYINKLVIIRRAKTF